MSILPLLQTFLYFFLDKNACQIKSAGVTQPTTKNLWTVSRYNCRLMPKKKYIKHLRSKSLNLSLNMMIHQIKASNYLMAPWITTVFLLDLIWKMALSYFFLMLFMKSPKEMNDDDLVGKKFLLACHSKNSIHFCCQRNSIKRRGSKHQNRTISISKVGKLSSLYSKNFFFLILLWCNSKVIRFFFSFDRWSFRIFIFIDLKKRDMLQFSNDE